MRREFTEKNDVNNKPIDVVQFRSEFNRLLFKAMQGKESAIEKIFSKSFIGQEKTEELHEFSRISRSHRLMTNATKR